jgi:hypothetical protein
MPIPLQIARAAWRGCFWHAPPSMIIAISRRSTQACASIETIGLAGRAMVQKSRKPSVVCVTPHGASQALRALHVAQRTDNLRVEIAAARVLDAYCQGRPAAVEDLVAAHNFLSATEAMGEP